MRMYYKIYRIQNEDIDIYSIQKKEKQTVFTVNGVEIIERNFDKINRKIKI